ncbi:septin-9 isoform X1 [Esox lucius]|uniref:septin-9 isoform X1 n=2 Tax=Esox lucius TaxID=8010 RepID=UPI001476D222|nr:septin-9 isoform X1 [Esox lucius]
MSEISVNDHLEGILSDFEALKRSFDVDDVDGLPPFSPSSPVPSPLSPTSLITKTNEGRGHATSNHSSSSFRSRISLGSNPSPVQSPVLKPRIVSSTSFNRGTMNRPFFQNNGGGGGGIARALSFQNKFNPNGFSSSGPGSDNESLHSSSSSLEYFIQGGGAPPGKPVSLSYFNSPQTEHHPGQQGGDGLGMKKFSSHGSVFHSELEASDPRGTSHGSMPSLDLRSADVGGGVMGSRRAGGGAVKYGNANVGWNGASQRHNNSPNQNHCSYQALPKPREAQRLNKFPLDLESLVGVAQPSSTSSDTPRPPLRAHCPSSHSVSACSSPSLSSLDSSSGDLTPVPHSLPLSSPASPQGAKPVPEVSRSPVPLPPAQTPQLNLLSPRPPPATAPPQEDTRESVGSILQRIASFSRPDAATPPMTPPTRVPSVAGVQSTVGLSNGVKKDSPATRMMMMKDQECIPVEDQDTSKVLDQETPAPWEETGMEEEKVTEAESKSPEESAVEEEKKGVEERERGVEREMEVKMEVELDMQDTPPNHTEGHGLQGTIKGRDLFGYVGIEAVLDQMRRKTMKAGFEFNIMVVGQSGLGKSTLVNTLFKSKVSRKSCTPNYEEKISKTVKLQSVSHVIEEKGVKMKLTVIDTPGFGDQINNENCWEPIVNYVNEQYERYLKEELYVNRKRRIPDTRVHCCVYFLPATGHWLRPIDVEFMKRLGKIVSIVPVIAKADTLTMEERQEFKQRIRHDLKANGIRVYPQTEYDEDPEDRILNDKIRENIPFAVVGTDKEHQVNGNKVLGRKTKWGIIEVENMAHCEFANLRDLLIRSHLQDLKDVTHNIHYETFRVRRLNESNLTVHGLALSCFPMENGTNRTNGTNGTSDRSDSESHL